MEVAAAVNPLVYPGPGLPPPDAEALYHSERLAERIRQEMGARGGWLPFDRFMDLALYAPGLGYYAAGTQKLGAGGDFITAPELTPLFSRCLASQCDQILGLLGGGEILELGAGSGVMAADLLLELEHLGRLPAAYLILEVSPELRARQQATLAARVPHILPRLGWLDTLPKRLTGILLANEVMDALPVSRFRVTAPGVIEECFLTWTGEDWREAFLPPANSDLIAAVHALQARGLAKASGYQSEVNLRLKPWVAALAECLQRGVALLIDYGYPQAEYYHAERTTGTLMCHYRHLAHGALYRWVGLQDITAHVDFTAAAEAGLAAGFDLAGYTTQAHFLLGCGLDSFLSDMDPQETEAHLRAVQAVKRLLLPQHMGERFQVLGLQQGVGEPLRGFSLRDLRDRL